MKRSPWMIDKQEKRWHGVLDGFVFPSKRRLKSWVGWWRQAWLQLTLYCLSCRRAAAAFLQQKVTNHTFQTKVPPLPMSLQSAPLLTLWRVQIWESKHVKDHLRPNISNIFADGLSVGSMSVTFFADGSFICGPTWEMFLVMDNSWVPRQ